jgi:hypothetical protein
MVNDTVLATTILAIIIISTAAVGICLGYAIGSHPHTTGETEYQRRVVASHSADIGRLCRRMDTLASTVGRLRQSVDSITAAEPVTPVTVRHSL